MRGFTVVSWPPAQRDLAELWIAAVDRQAIADAANLIELLLSKLPSAAGFEIAEGLRGLVEEPLYVQFSVDEADRIVTVGSVRLIT
jgi:hypothetical protein